MRGGLDWLRDWRRGDPKGRKEERSGEGKPRSDMSAVHSCSSSVSSSARLRFGEVPRLRGLYGSGRGAGSGVAVTRSGAGGGIFRALCGHGDAGGVAAMPPQGAGGARQRYGHVTGERGHGELCSRCVGKDVDGEGVLGDGNGHVGDMGSSEKKFLTLPTILTLSRVAAVPALLAGTENLAFGI